MKTFPLRRLGLAAGLVPALLLVPSGSPLERAVDAPSAPPAEAFELDDDTRVSPEARESAERALRWLIAAQNRDGSWGDNPGSPGEIGNTCIAGLALLATGDNLTRGKHCWRIRRAVQWVMQRTKGYGANHTQLDNATLLQRKLGQNIPLYLVAIFYSQVVGHGLDAHDDRRMLTEMRAMADRVSSLQKSNGEWETSYEPSLTTIAAWLALRQTAAVGVTVNAASADKVHRYLVRDCYDPASGIFRDKKWGNRMRFVTQAGALRVLYGMGKGDSTEAVKGTAAMLKMRFDQDVGGRSGGEEFLGALYATQALHVDRESPAFAKWYAKIVKGLRACQNRDGSWMGHHCITGRVFCTACSIMSLLTPNKLLPMLER